MTTFSYSILLNGKPSPPFAARKFLLRFPILENFLSYSIPTSLSILLSWEISLVIAEILTTS